MPAAAHNGVLVIDRHARAIGSSGVACFRIVNHETTEDTLLSISSPDAAMVMLMNDHADAADSDGVMKMTDRPEGLAIAAKDQRVRASAGDHVMPMNLTRKLKDGVKVTLILIFQHAGAVAVTLPIDNKRLTEPGAGPTADDASSPE